MQAPHLDKPIGHWIKKADDALNRHIDAAQQRYGLNRLSWQVLHTICAHPPLTMLILADLMAPFASESELYTVLRSLVDQNLLTWTEQPNDIPACTPAGLELHKHCLAQQQRVRQQAMQHISNEQYALTVETLQLLITNLDQLNSPAGTPKTS